ncbi:hypothetical protein DAERI_020313 [Deinococcus aerius]|uniref:Uncharacterized protein n=1 Tax=Deinococcus aerius TaxID=200253 RepID=A0A2I9D2K5_9DEIO|nr:hypothetical protein [Deinococcus aerius]GBF04716.1 hypothetical protein DAERI_020313 [Deinococcus aerius]
MPNALNETTYSASLARIQELWCAGAGQADHPAHAEFHALYEDIMGYEQEAGMSTAPEPAFQIDTVERLEWFVGKKADIQSKIARVKAQAAAMIRELEREEAGLDWRFGTQAERVLRAQLSGRKKSVKFLVGTAGIRKAPGRVQVTDEATLERAILTQAPYLDSVIVTRIDTRTLNQLLKVEGDVAHLTEDGTRVELPGLSVTPVQEKFYVRAGQEDEA